MWSAGCYTLGMTKLVALFGFAFLALTSVGCSAETDADEGGDEAMNEDDLRTAGIKSIKVGRSAGFRPPPQPGKCWPAGSWSFDFETRKLTGDACVDEKPATIDLTLSEADAARVKKAVSDVRVTTRPQACPTDMPITSLVVKRAKSETRYVDQRASCGSSSIPAKAGLGELFDLMQELSANPAATLPPCVRTGCSGQICADSHRISTCEFRPEYACYRSAACERGADGQCGFRQTPELAACIASK